MARIHQLNSFVLLSNWKRHLCEIEKVFFRVRHMFIFHVSAYIFTSTTNREKKGLKLGLSSIKILSLCMRKTIFHNKKHLRINLLIHSSLVSTITLEKHFMLLFERFRFFFGSVYMVSIVRVIVAIALDKIPKCICILCTNWRMLRTFIVSLHRLLISFIVNAFAGNMNRMNYNRFYFRALRNEIGYQEREQT